MATLKTYVVKNPRGVPSGVHVIDVGGVRFFEGHDFKETTALIRDGSVKWLVENGFIEVKPNG